MQPTHARLWPNHHLKIVSIVLISLLDLGVISGFSANKVHLELRENGRYRITIQYTSPEQKEFRNATIEYSKKEEAEEVYSKLIGGADFVLHSDGKLKFIPPPTPDPW